MTTKELAALLNGREYGEEILRHEAAAAKAAGLVVVFRSSDDLMEFRGAINDEVGAGTVRVDKEGLVPDFDEACDAPDCERKDRLREYFRRENASATIKAVWDTEGYSRVYETAIPHETFEIVEDGEKYCRGIVFALADVPGAGR